MNITDQIGTRLEFDHTPKRIVSLVPSQTELLVHLGLEEHIVGVTKFCVHPSYLRSDKEVVGGTKQVDIAKITALEPDIILCNKEENTKEIVESLQALAPVHTSDIITVQESLDLILQYGLIFNKETQAQQLVTAITEERNQFLKELKTSSQGSVGYFIWKEPMMVAGADTFINTLLEEAGFKNAFTSLEGRYPEVQAAQLVNLDYIFLSSEPFPFKEEHIALFKKNTTARVVLVDGEYFSWYGSRLLAAYSYFKNLRAQLELQEL
ncbi:cobalamin-binding protein [Dokdonia sp. Dokd-P16]|uniref:ABC transporter substrate-binding protein n=1 Tax=Dokdonia sp. Dokd-P16 TaxID=2173169 RepID=UPI000D547370|nr:helical backbone metal receptor [Dokdonia sp. Dokd-P16]AWH74771.1 cobalamin-binding protein [Dokdonia sp. Dokd-P16]